MENGTLTDRFSSYFNREVAQAAAKSIGNGAEIEFQIIDSGSQPAETFTFTKAAGKNSVVPGSARDPQLAFTMDPKAAEEILDFQSDNIGEIGVHIAKMVVAKRVQVRFRSGFLSLFSKGYLGVLTHGGGQFASYLASNGLNGIGAIKTLLSKRK